jgi:hypothetical protein
MKTLLTTASVSMLMSGVAMGAVCGCNKTISFGIEWI